MMFCSEDLKLATNDYNSDAVVGEGGFGKVYRGRLRYSDVAVKVLSDVRLKYTLSYAAHYINFSARDKYAKSEHRLTIKNRNFNIDKVIFTNLILLPTSIILYY